MNSYVVGFRTGGGKFEEHYVSASDLFSAIDDIFFKLGFNTLISDVDRPVSLYVREIV